MDFDWQWVVVFAACLVNVLVFGTVAAGGVISMAILRVYDGATKANVVWVVLTLHALTNLLGPFSVLLGNKFSYRLVVISSGLVASIGLIASVFTYQIEALVVTYGLLLGIGFSLAASPAVVVVGIYAKKKRAVANGICMAGAPIGSFLLAPFVEYLLEEYTLRGTFFIMSAILLHICVCGALFRPLPPVKTEETLILQSVENSIDNSEKCSDSNKFSENGNAAETLLKGPTNGVNGHPRAVYRETTERIVKRCCYLGNFWFLKHGIFLLVTFGWGMLMFALTCFAIMTPNFASTEMVGIDRTDAAFIISAMAAGDLTGRLTYGLVVDRKWFPSKYGYMLTMSIAGISCLCAPFSGSYRVFCFVAVIFGLGVGCTAIQHPLLVIEYVGLEAFKSGYGFLNGFAGITTLSMTGLVGYMRSATGSDTSNYLLLGAILLTVALLWLLEPVLMRKHRLPSVSLTVPS